MPESRPIAPVSVVIPAYNREKLIVRALDSVVNQTYIAAETLVVDDGSTDGTVAAVSRWIEAHQSGGLSVRCIRQKNQGANAARNRGIQESLQEYIAFLDSDDRWLPAKLEKQLALIQADVEIGGVYCGTDSIDLQSGKVIHTGRRSYPQGDILRQMLVRDVTSPTSCWMIRRRSIEKTGLFDDRLPARQDWDMWIRLSSHYGIAAVPEVLVEMGEHSGERVRSDASREIFAHRAIFKKYLPLRKQFPFWVSLSARSAMYRRRGRVYFHRKISFPKAVALQFMAIGTWPFAFDSYAALFGMMLPAGLRQHLHRLWNRLLGKTRLAIRSH